MADGISAAQFEEADGVEDWRVVAHGACAHFRTGAFATGLALVNAVAELAETANHHPDVDLRYAAVTVRLMSHDIGGLSRRDLALAQQISAAARALEVTADPAAVQVVDLAIDAQASSEVMPFWRAVLGYDQVGEEDLVDPLGRWPAIWFQEMDAPRPQRNRIHVDVWVPHDQAEPRIQAAIAAGGHLVSGEHAPAWWTLADAEGNEVDVVTWRGRD